jgi:hypothetical protein
MRAAGGVEVRRAVAAVELVGRADPFGRPANVAASIAASDRAAADQDDGVQIAALPGQRPGHRFVKERRAVVRATDRDQRGTKLPLGTQLEVAVGRGYAIVVAVRACTSASRGCPLSLGT